MEKITLIIILFSSILSTSAFAADLNLGQLVPADKIAQGDFIPAPTPATADAPVAGGPGPGPGLPADIPPCERWWFRCFSTNPPGLLFTAVGKIPEEAQDFAMRKCFSVPPALCKPLGCRIEY